MPIRAVCCLAMAVFAAASAGAQQSQPFAAGPPLKLTPNTIRETVDWSCGRTGRST
jgi:hypothetical protein